MTIAYTCIIICIFIPFFLAGYSKKYSTIKYDNNLARNHVSQLSGKSLNAYNAEQNCYESFPPFAAAVVIAHQLGHDQSIIDLLAVTFVICRLLYVLLYINDHGTLRSVAWTLGFISMVSLFFIG